MIDRRITDFIARHHVLTLSTVADGMPHCCNLFYAYDPQRNLFAVTSSDETLHARQARQNPRIAASVVLETRVVGKVQGLQIRGTMMPAGSGDASFRTESLSRTVSVRGRGQAGIMDDPARFHETDRQPARFRQKDCLGRPN